MQTTDTATHGILGVLSSLFISPLIFRSEDTGRNEPEKGAKKPQERAPQKVC